MHGAEIEDDFVAQRATGPVVAAAAHRQRKVAVTRGPNRRLDVVGVRQWTTARGMRPTGLAQIAVAAA